jgi:hypothetical protein
MANIYGNTASGIGSAINSGMNNYMTMNALAPQAVDTRNAALSSQAMQIAQQQVPR